MRRSLLLATALLAISAPALSQSVDRGQVNRIIDEGTTRSQVMLTAEHLADVIGPRLTNSPQMRQAETWTQSKFSEWGLKNVHKEGFDFGRGWWIESSSVKMVSWSCWCTSDKNVRWRGPSPFNHSDAGVRL